MKPKGKATPKANREKKQKNIYRFSKAGKAAKVYKQ